MVGAAVAASTAAALLAWLTLAPGGASPAAERSVEAADVPDGPWREIVTRRGGTG